MQKFDLTLSDLNSGFFNAMKDQKDRFFKHFTRHLAKKHGLTTFGVSLVRNICLGEHQSRADVANVLTQSLNKKRRAIDLFNKDLLAYDSEYSLSFYHSVLAVTEREKILTFVLRCSDEEWTDITQTTKFDRKEKPNG